MPISITINGSITLDESAGLQTGGSATATEDNNDSDISLATLQSGVSSFYNRLFGVGELNLSSAFATANGVARSASNYISLTGTGSVISLGFTSSTGAALPVLGSGTGVSTGLFALDGGAISLFTDPGSELGNRVAYGVDEDGDIVFALFMEPAANLLTARVWMVQFEPLDNPVDTNHDDFLALTGLGVGAGVSTEFVFAGLPSGQNLFGMVGTAGSGIIVFGQNTDLNADGTFTNASNTINTSQGGGRTTIGVNNQMFDPNDGAYFTYVRGANANFLGSNLDANEADDADNMLYSDGDAATNDTIESDGAFLRIAQLQGNGTATMRIDAYNIAGSPQGEDLIDASGQNAVEITRVKVYDSAGNLLADSNAGNAGLITFNLAGLSAVVSGLNAGYKVEWFTNGVHDQVKITGVAGKFDIGGFGINEPSAVSAPLTGVRFEDDGPSVDLELHGDAELVVDESVLDAVASQTVAQLFSTNTATFGTDGAGTDDSVYKLVLGNANSGLFDTKTGLEVILSINAAGTLISGKVNDGGLVDVFTIAIDPDTGTVTLTQKRAMVHDDTSDPDEANSPLTLANGTVSVQRVITDGDDDTASDTVDISSIFAFEDAGPTQPDAGENAPPLVTDDSDIADDAAVSTADIFPDAPSFGSDGPHAINPILFSLRLDDLAPGDGDDPDSGLVDTATGKAIRWVQPVAGGDIIGYVDLDGDGEIEAGDPEAVRFSLVPIAADPPNVEVTFTQTRAVFHAVADSEETILGNTVFVERKAFDGDGDPADAVDFDLSEITAILDDEPAIGPISNGIVDFAINDSVSNPLNGDVGNDPNASPYTITAFTATVQAGSVELGGVLEDNGTTVTYYEDTDGDEEFGSAGDTAFYRLTLDQAGGGEYTFTVLRDPPPSFTEFDFTYLPSGQSLFGVLVDQDDNMVQDLDGLGLLVVGRDAVIKNPGDGTYTNASDTINTSQGGGAVTIGVDNQMFDPGDGAVFVYLDNPDNKSIAINPESGGGGLTQTSADDADTLGFAGTAEARGGEIEVVQKQGGAVLGMKISAYDVDVPGADDTIVSANDPQSQNPPTTDDESAEARSFIDNPLAGATRVSITGIRVYDRANPSDILESWDFIGGVWVNTDGDGDGIADNAAGISLIHTVVSGANVVEVRGFTPNDTIAWTTAADHDAVLIEGTSGKWDVGGFNIAQGNDTPDQLLEFTAQVTDGDADTDSASWKIGIDGTGIHDDNMVSGVII